MNKVFFNFFELLVSKIEVRVPYIRFRDREYISILRSKYSNAIFTHSRDKIYYYLEGTTNTLDCDGYQIINRESDTYLFLNLIRDAFLDVFYGNREQYRIYKNTGGFYEITVFD